MQIRRKVKVLNGWSSSCENCWLTSLQQEWNKQLWKKINLKVEICNYYKHFLAFTDYQDSDWGKTMNNFLSYFPTSRKLPIASLMEEDKPVILEKYALGNRELYLIVRILALPACDDSDSKTKNLKYFHFGKSSSKKGCRLTPWGILTICFWRKDSNSIQQNWNFLILLHAGITERGNLALFASRGARRAQNWHQKLKSRRKITYIYKQLSF